MLVIFIWSCLPSVRGGNPKGGGSGGGEVAGVGAKVKNDPLTSVLTVRREDWGQSGPSFSRPEQRLVKPQMWDAAARQIMSAAGLQRSLQMIFYRGRVGGGVSSLLQSGERLHLPPRPR